MNHRIFPLGDNALTIDFGNVISVEFNDKVRGLAEYFMQNQFAGFVEVVPAYSSLTVFYDVVKVRTTFGEHDTAFAAVKNLVENALLQSENLSITEPRLVKIPVCYEAEFAPDIEFVAELNNLTTKEVIEIHTSKTYRVFMVGFLPGFPYLGEVDERITAPRQSEPRLKVPQGSVGIAGRQTGIYPLESPGGWQIIGRTPLSLFNPNQNPPTLLQSGDSVQFYAIDKETFALNQSSESRL